MSKELVISASPHETRVAILEDGHLCEFYVEREKEFALVGSIYKGRVTRVLPGMQSAFVDIGLDSDAFLYVSDFLENLEEYDSIVTTVEGKVSKMEEQGGQVFAPPAADTPAVTEPADVVLLEGETRANRGAPPAAASTGGNGEATTPSYEAPAPPSSSQQASAPPVHEDRGRRGGFDRGGRGDRGYGRGDRGGFGRDRERGGRGRGRFGRRGRDDRPPREWSGPRREFPPSKYAPPSSGEPSGPASYEPIILPGESLAKYRTRAPATEAAIPATDAAAIAPEMETREAAPPDVPTETAEQAAPLEVPAAFSSNLEQPEAQAAAAPEPPSYEAPAPVPARVSEFQAPSAEEVRAPEPAVEPSPVYVPPSFEEPAPAPAPRLSEPAPREAEAAVAPEELGVEPAEHADYGAYLEERIAAAESLDEYAQDALEAEVEDALDEAEEAEAMAHAGEGHDETTVNGQPEAAAEGDAPRSARIEKDSRARFQRPMRRGPDRGGRGRRRGFHGRPRRAGPFRPKQTQQISEVLKAGEEIIVQIAKEPLGKKGARITSHVALPGRFLVYMPTVDHIGVSRKIGSAEERSRLRRLLLEMKSTYSGGFIVRTAAGGATDEEVRTDVEFLTRTWNEIKQRFEQRKSPAILHRDLNLVERILRDHLSGDFTAIWLDNEEEFTKVAEFVGRFQPKLVNRVKLYTKEAPIFEEFGIQQEIDKSLRPKVWLKSGGYIVINHTEALVAIDVNTGKFVGKGSTRLEDTIVKTNLEAVKEIVRQIRLRDLGGIIVIDFIDMEERKNREQVMRALDEALRDDKAPSKALGFNEFGLVAITRKRTKQALERVLCQPCPYCTGSGMVKSIPTICYEIQAEARKMAPEIDSQSVTLRVHPEIGKALKTRESVLVEELERWIRKSVIIQSDPTLHWEQYDIF
jgi:ribonuclease G